MPKIDDAKPVNYLEKIYERLVDMNCGASSPVDLSQFITKQNVSFSANETLTGGTLLVDGVEKPIYSLYIAGAYDGVSSFQMDLSDYNIDTLLRKDLFNHNVGSKGSVKTSGFAEQFLRGFGDFKLHLNNQVFNYEKLDKTLNFESLDTTLDLVAGTIEAITSNFYTHFHVILEYTKI